MRSQSSAIWRVFSAVSAPTWTLFPIMPASAVARTTPAAIQPGFLYVFTVLGIGLGHSPGQIAAERPQARLVGRVELLEQPIVPELGGDEHARHALSLAVDRRETARRGVDEVGLHLQMTGSTGTASRAHPLGGHVVGRTQATAQVPVSIERSPLRQFIEADTRPLGTLKTSPSDRPR